MELAEKTCIPCRGGIPPLAREQREALLKQLDPGWELYDVDAGVTAVRKTYRFADFAQALAFADRIGTLAEEQAHHPDLHVSWGRLTVEIWTHKIKGLTESDFIFAAKCDRLADGSNG